MNFDFPEDLKQLRDEARRFLAARCPPAVTRSVLESDEPFDRPLWSALAGLGWTGAAIPEEYGGSGLGALGLCVLAEEMGRAAAPVPFASSVCAASEALLAFGDETQKRRFLPRLAAGETIGTLAYAERPGISDPRRLGARAEGGRLHGSKYAVPDGMAAEFAIVAVNGGRGPWLYLAELAGAAREPVATIDPSRKHARIVFDGVAAEPLARADSAEQVRRLLDRLAVLMAFEQLGLAERAMEMARDYALQRYAFGRPIGSFQAIKHKLAEVYIAVELARSNAYYGAWALSTDAAELPIAASVARIAACEAGWIATKENIQTHGGMGFTWQFDCHLYYRRAKMLGLALGSAREWKHRLIDQLRARNVAEMATD
ncbi:MAG TPA: acyl-CoA dehydrogenase family protein [Acetobacteraceae bacterium]|nr:acyl-CoA dehydrogenase family protein [Acetobacteraceae bacterium]